MHHLSNSCEENTRKNGKNKNTFLYFWLATVDQEILDIRQFTIILLTAIDTIPN